MFLRSNSRQWVKETSPYLSTIIKVCGGYVVLPPSHAKIAAREALASAWIAAKKGAQT